MRMKDWIASGTGMRQVFGKMLGPDGDTLYASGGSVAEVSAKLTALGGDAATFSECGANECGWGLHAMRAKREMEGTTECGKVWASLPSACSVCNGGPHYHFADGGCDTEPCTRHGGPQ